ncbi:uncharacterized protein LOC144447173 [Glandiceps talaboti]
MDAGELFVIIYKLWFSFVFIYALVFIVSVILLVGVQNDQKALLLPYVVYMIFFMLADSGISIYVLMQLGLGDINTFNLILYIYRMVVTICCELCVISQYQLLASGKGMKAQPRDPASPEEACTVSMEEPEQTAPIPDRTRLTRTAPSHVKREKELGIIVVDEDHPCITVSHYIHTGTDTDDLIPVKEVMAELTYLVEEVRQGANSVVNTIEYVAGEQRHLREELIEMHRQGDSRDDMSEYFGHYNPVYFGT